MIKLVLHTVVLLAILAAWVYTGEELLLGIIAGQLGGAAIERTPVKRA